MKTDFVYTGLPYYMIEFELDLEVTLFEHSLNETEIKYFTVEPLSLVFKGRMNTQMCCGFSV